MNVYVNIPLNLQVAKLFYRKLTYWNNARLIHNRVLLRSSSLRLSDTFGSPNGTLKRTPESFYSLFLFVSFHFYARWIWKSLICGFSRNILSRSPALLNYTWNSRLKYLDAEKFYYRSFEVHKECFLNTFNIDRSESVIWPCKRA